jgi:hypothetical protein
VKQIHPVQSTKVPSSDLLAQGDLPSGLVKVAATFDQSLGASLSDVFVLCSGLRAPAGRWGCELKIPIVLRFSYLHTIGDEMIRALTGQKVEHGRSFDSKMTKLEGKTIGGR